MESVFSRLILFDDVISDIFLDGVSIAFQSHKMQVQYRSVRSLFPVHQIQTLLKLFIKGKVSLEQACLAFMNPPAREDDAWEEKIGEALLKRKKMMIDNSNSNSNSKRELMQWDRWIGDLVPFHLDNGSIIEFYE